MNKYALIYSVLLLSIGLSLKGQSIIDTDIRDTINLEQNKNTKHLSETELRAYQLIDSIKKAEQNEKELEQLELIVNRSISTKYLNLPINKLIDYNNYEGFRLGLGIIIK